MVTEVMTSPEQLVFNWLTQRKIPFRTQVGFLGGVTEAGGARVDFVLDELNIIIRVQSYWHSVGAARARDELQRIALVNEGWIVVDVQEEDLNENLNETMSKALKGEE